MKKLSVLMPVYNESRTLRTIIKRVLDSPVSLDIELICVDDGSTDSSLEVMREASESDPRLKVYAHGVNRGKGRAVRTAIEHMTGDIAIIQDSDLEYDPAEYPKIIAPILEGVADAVYGSRFASSEVRRVLFFWHALGNGLLTFFSNMANDINLTDMETGYKAVRGDLLKRLRLTSDRFGLEPEITARLARSGARMYEVPISYRGRTYSEGKNIGWVDGLEALWLIFKFRFVDTRHVIDDGHATLESLAGAPAISRWMLEPFRPFLGSNVFEAGCGAGNITEHLLDRGRLHVVDIDPAHVDAVRSRFGHLENVGVSVGDLTDAATYDRLDGGFDSVVCMNVLEHLDRPGVAMKGFAQVLKPGGHVLILVPAHNWLYSAADEALGHHMRYSRRELVALLEEAGLEIVTVSEFNRLGVVGWLVNKVLRRTNIGRLQARAFSLLLPVARLFEHGGALPGLSWIAIARAR